MSTATFVRASLAPVEEAVARYHRETPGRQIAEDLDLDPSNVSRRFSSALRPERLLDCFTGRQVLRMIAGDAARGGDLLDRLMRTVRGQGEGDASAVPASARELERRCIAIVHAIVEAAADGAYSVDEAADITNRVRLLIMAAEGSVLPNFDAASKAVRK